MENPPLHVPLNNPILSYTVATEVGETNLYRSAATPVMNRDVDQSIMALFPVSDLLFLSDANQLAWHSFRSSSYTKSTAGW
jgi:hypothetical protein